MEDKKQETGGAAEEFTIEGRNAVTEAFRAGRSIDRVYILDGCQDGPEIGRASCRERVLDRV